MPPTTYNTASTRHAHMDPSNGLTTYDYIERLFKDGVILQSKRLSMHDAAMKLDTPSATPTSSAPLVTNNYTTPEAETRSSFITLRTENLGPYKYPKPGPDIREWISDFPSSDEWLCEDFSDCVDHYRICSKNYRNMMRWIKSQAFVAPDPLLTPEPLMCEFRNFMGHMMALYYLTELRGPTSYKIGGLANAFSCDPSLLVGSLSLMLNREGKDSISTTRVFLQQQRLVSSRPNNAANTGTGSTPVSCAKCKMASRPSTNHSTRSCGLPLPVGWVVKYDKYGNAL